MGRQAGRNEFGLGAKSSEREEATAAHEKKVGGALFTPAQQTLARKSGTRTKVGKVAGQSQPPADLGGKATAVAGACVLGDSSSRCVQRLRHPLPRERQQAWRGRVRGRCDALLRGRWSSFFDVILFFQR